MPTRIKEALDFSNYSLACCEEALDHYGEPPLTLWERFVIWAAQFISYWRGK
jgi:hypothetical protein